MVWVKDRELDRLKSKAKNADRQRAEIARLKAELEEARELISALLAAREGK